MGEGFNQVQAAIEGAGLPQRVFLSEPIAEYRRRENGIYGNSKFVLEQCLPLQPSTPNPGPSVSPFFRESVYVTLDFFCQPLVLVRACPKHPFGNLKLACQCYPELAGLRPGNVQLTELAEAVSHQVDNLVPARRLVGGARIPF